MLKATVVAITMLIVSSQGTQNPYSGGYPNQYAPPHPPSGQDPYASQQGGRPPPQHREYSQQYGAPPPPPGQFQTPPGYPGSGDRSLTPYGRGPPRSQPPQDGGGGGLFAK